MNEKIIKYIIKNVKQFNETIFIIKILHINEIKNQQFSENDSKDIVNNLIHNSANLMKINETDVIVEKAVDEVVDEKNKQTKQNKLN